MPAVSSCDRLDHRANVRQLWRAIRRRHRPTKGAGSLPARTCAHHFDAPAARRGRRPGDRASGAARLFARGFPHLPPGGKLGAQLQRAIDLAHTGAPMPILPVGSPMSMAVIEMSSKGFRRRRHCRWRAAADRRDHRRRPAPPYVGWHAERAGGGVMSHSPRVIRGDILASAALKSMQTASA